MMVKLQNVVCEIQQCGFRSNSGFCLNRLVSIGANGVCKWINREGWMDNQ